MLSCKGFFRGWSTLLSPYQLLRVFTQRSKTLRTFLHRTRRVRVKRWSLWVARVESNDRIGFLTNEDVRLPGLEGRVAVYMPMSYQIGGYTAFVPKSWVREVDLGVEEAMRSALTAWMPNN